MPPFINLFQRSLKTADFTIDIQILRDFKVLCVNGYAFWVHNILPFLVCGKQSRFQGPLYKRDWPFGSAYGLGVGLVWSFTQPLKKFYFCIKFGLVNNFVKSMLKINSERFKCILRKLKKLARLKKKKIFIRLKIKEVLNDFKFKIIWLLKLKTLLTFK